MSKLVQVDDATFGEIVEGASGVTVVDFWATWCGPCRMIEPSLERIAEERRDVKIVKINNDENIRTAARFGVRGLPTLLIFKDGKAVDQVIGAVSKDRINAVIDKYVTVAA
jgi:thioredoxin 1